MVFPKKNPSSFFSPFVNGLITCVLFSLFRLSRLTLRTVSVHAELSVRGVWCSNVDYAQALCAASLLLTKRQLLAFAFQKSPRSSSSRCVFERG